MKWLDFKSSLIKTGGSFESLLGRKVGKPRTPPLCSKKGASSHDRKVIYYPYCLILVLVSSNMAVHESVALNRNDSH